MRQSKIEFDLPGAKAWKTLWTRLGAKGDALKAFHDLAAKYHGSRRAYHNMDHIQNVLAELPRGRHLCFSSLNELELAAWYHDAIYDPRATDNEEQSAHFAHVEIARMAVATGVSDKVSQMILATKHNSPPRSPEEAVLVDADLAVLGYPQDKFDHYELAIRQEYSHVPDEQYKPARTAVLKKFLERPTIYYTKSFQSAFEAGARDNLQKAINLLA